MEMMNNGHTNNVIIIIFMLLNFLFLQDDIRKNLGVCPQYDILFPELTVN